MAILHKFHFSVALIVLLGAIVEVAPRPNPVEVFGGYSSVSKSVTYTKRLEFQMNKDQSLKAPIIEHKSAINSIKTNDTAKEAKKTPHVNHSVQFSIGTNIKSDEEGMMDPPSVMESIANDINEMKKMVKNGIKMSEVTTSTTSSPSVELEGNAGRLELSLENYDDALYEDVAPDDTSSLDNREKFPVTEIPLEKTSILEDREKYPIDTQPKSSISNVNANLPDTLTESSAKLDYKPSTKSPFKEITEAIVEDSTSQSTENYSELTILQKEKLGMGKTDDMLVEFPPSASGNQQTLTEVPEEAEIFVTQQFLPQETEAPLTVKDDIQFSDRPIETEGIHDNLQHSDEFKSKVPDSLDEGHRSTDLSPSSDQTLSDLGNETKVAVEPERNQLENSSKAFDETTEKYDDVVKNSSIASLRFDTGNPSEITINELGVTESLLTDVVGIERESQIDAAVRIPEEQALNSMFDTQFKEDGIKDEVKTTTVLTEDSKDAGIAVTTYSTPTQPAELSENIHSASTPASSEIVSNTEENLELKSSIGAFVNDSGDEDRFPTGSPPVDDLLAAREAVEVQNDNEYNYGSYYPTDYEYVDFDETTDRTTTTADMLFNYEYNDDIDTTDIPETSTDSEADEVTRSTGFESESIHERQFLTSTTPTTLTDSMRTENFAENGTSNLQNESTTFSPLESQKSETRNLNTEKKMNASMNKENSQNRELIDSEYTDFENFERISEGRNENDSVPTSVPTTEREPFYPTDLPLGASIEIGDFGSDYVPKTEFLSSNTAKQKSPQAANEDRGQLEAPQKPSIDIPALISNIDFSKIDFSDLNLSGLEDPIAQIGIENGGTVPPLNLDGADLSTIISDLGLGHVDLSNFPSDFDVRNIDISGINLENIPPFELGGNLGLFQLPNTSQNKAAQSNPNIANLYGGSNVGNVVSPYAHSLNRFNPGNPQTRIPDLYDHSVDPSRVNLNIDDIRQLPAGFRHPHLPHTQHSHVPHLTSLSGSPYFGLRGETGDQFLVVENGRNFDTSSAVHLQRPGRVIDSGSSVESPHFVAIQQTQSNLNHPAGEKLPGNIKFRTEPRYPEPNTVNFFHPLDFVDPSSFQSSVSATNHQLQNDKNIENLYEDYHDEGAFGVKVPAQNLTTSAINDFNLPNLTQLGPLLEGHDLSQIDLTQIPSNLNLSDIDLSSIPSNFSIEGLDIDKIVSSIDLSKLDLSKVNLGELNIPKIMEQLSSSSLDLTLFGQPSFGREAEKNFHVERAVSSEPNADEKFLPTPGSVPGDEVVRSKWITENETDQKVLDELGISHFLTMANSISLDGGESSNFLLCTMCKTGVVTGRKLMTDLAKTDREILSLVIYMCIEFKVFPKDVCRGMINSVGYEVLHVLRNTQHNPEIFCSMLLAGTCEEMPLPAWSLNTPERSTSVRAEPSVHTSRGDFLILHISDLHTDPEYAAGTDAECDYPLCCRDWTSREGRGYRRDESSPNRPMESFAVSVMANADDPNTDMPTKPQSVSKFPKHAGRWGAFGRCDLPLRSVDRILQAGADLQPDLVYITGDLPPHDVWQQTKESVQQINALTAERIRLAFPDTPLVMTVGNHEVEPINSFPVPEVYDEGFNPSWLYESLATQWKQWVPSSSVPTLIKGGYYAVTPYPGLRVLSINGNYCNSMNWWLMIAHKDPTEQLVWMDRQLAEADAAGEKVHILTHIPPGYHECLPSWSREFARIVTKYADVVTGIFSGHQHLDQWEVIYDPENSTRPVSVVYVAPSATTFREHSPSFRTFSVDGGKGNESSWVVVDHDTYTANLTIANLPDNILEFGHRYSAKQAFNMTDLSPQSWSDVITAMASNQTMFNKHMRFKHNYWAEPTEIDDCDRKCKEKSLCFLVTGDSSNKEPCERLKKIIT